MTGGAPPCSASSFLSADRHHIGAKLFDEMAHYRGDKAPVGAFIISQLILKAPPKLWKEVRESMDVQYEAWR